MLKPAYILIYPREKHAPSTISECYLKDQTKTKILEGKTLEVDVNRYQVDMDFEKSGNNKCIQEFMANEDMYCIIMVKSGTLKINGCTLSLEY